METGKEGQEKNMKVIQWIKKKHFNRLCKKYPVLKLNDEILAIEEKLHNLYNTNPTEFFKILDILKIRFYYVPNMLIVNVFIDKEDYLYKMTLRQPECWNNGTP